MAAPYSVAYQIGATGTSKVLSTSTSVVLDIPKTASGVKPSFIRVAVSAGAAYFRLATSATSAVAITTDAIVTVSDSVRLNTLGYTSLGMLMVTGGNVVVGQISPLEDGVIIPSTGAVVG